MDFWARLAQLLFQLVNRYEEPAVALLILVEEAGVPLPLPGDVVILLAGYRIAQGEMDLVRTLVAAEVATVIGASILYWLGARGGRPVLYRFGRHLRLDPPRLDRAGEWLRRRGAWAVLLGRLTPGLRIITPLAAGAFGVPFRSFLPAMALGSFVYLSALMFIGAWFGYRAVEALEGLQLSLRAAVTVLLTLIVGALLLSLYRRASTGAAGPKTVGRSEVETAALAGLLATVEMALAVNLALYALAALSVPTRRETILPLLEAALPRFQVAGWTLALGLLVLMLVANVLLALLYARIDDRLPGPPWLRGLLFSLLPTAGTLLILLPALGAGPLGLGLGAGLLPALGETFRNAVYGLGLGTGYELLCAARDDEPDPAAPAPEAV